MELYSNFYVIDIKDNLLLKVQFPKHENIIKQLPRKCCLARATLFYRKDIILEIGGYNEINKK